MSQNKKIIETLAATDKREIGPLLADDVEWTEWGDGVPPSGVVTRGKDAYIQNYGDDELRTHIMRMTEEGNVVVAEGAVRVQKKDGRVFNVRFCDTYELEDGKVKRKSSFGVLLKDSA